MKYKVLKEFTAIDGKTYLANSEYEWEPGIAVTTFMLTNGFIEEIKEPWKPKEGDAYYVVCENGTTAPCYAEGKSGTKNRIALGNCFQTEEQAKKSVAWLKAFKVLRDDTKCFEPDWGDEKQKKWYVWWNIALQQLETGYNSNAVEHLIYFATEEDIKESIKTHQREWLTFLGVDEAKKVV